MSDGGHAAGERAGGGGAKGCEGSGEERRLNAGDWGYVRNARDRVWTKRWTEPWTRVVGVRGEAGLNGRDRGGGGRGTGGGWWNRCRESPS